MSDLEDLVDDLKQKCDELRVQIKPHHLPAACR